MEKINTTITKKYLEKRFIKVIPLLMFLFTSCISFHTKKYEIKEIDIPKGEIKPMEINTEYGKYSSIIDEKYFNWSEKSEYLAVLDSKEKSTYFPTTYLTMFTLCLLPCMQTVETSLTVNFSHNKTKTKVDAMNFELSTKEIGWLPIMIYEFTKLLVGIKYEDNYAFSIILEDTKPILYNKFKQMEKEVTIKEKEIQKQKQDILDNFRNTILGNLKKENVLVLNEVKDNFNLAHFNKKDFPNIFNSVQFEGDEFQYQKEKPMLNKIRNQKYLLIQPDACNDYFSEYDFKTKSYDFSYNQSVTKGGLPFGLGAGYSYYKMYSNEVTVPVPEAEAKEFKTSEKSCELLAEVMPTEISDTVYKCKIDSGGGDESIVLGDKETYNRKMKNKHEFHSCTSSIEKIKKLKLKIIKVGFMDSKTNKIYTN